MNAQTEPLPDLSAFVLHPPKNPIERSIDDEAGRLAMLDAMDETRSLMQ